MLVSFNILVIQEIEIRPESRILLKHMMGSWDLSHFFVVNSLNGPNDIELAIFKLCRLSLLVRDLLSLIMIVPGIKLSGFVPYFRFYIRKFNFYQKLCSLPMLSFINLLNGKVIHIQ